MDDRFDDYLEQAAGEYNPPPPTPREEMWARIRARRLEERAAAPDAAGAPPPARPAVATPVVRPIRRATPWIAWGAGIAAILALGIGIGRMTGPGQTPAPDAPAIAAGTPAPAADRQVAYRLVVTDHLGQAEAFLTLFRTAVRTGETERLAGATARQLLANNRLLLDSPAAGDARTRLLLEDLELVLAQIAQLGAERRDDDLELITEGMDRGAMLVRLRAAVPAGAGLPSTQGAL